MMQPTPNETQIHTDELVDIREVSVDKNLPKAAKRYGMEDNYVVGANIAGFEKVVDAMKAQGIV